MSIQYSPENLTIEGTGVTAPTMKEICIRGMACLRGVFRGCSVKRWGPATRQYFIYKLRKIEHSSIAQMLGSGLEPRYLPLLSVAWETEEILAG